MIFGKIILLTVTFQVTFSLDGALVDSVVKYCRNKVDKFIATEEDQYIRKHRRDLSEPPLYGGNPVEIVPLLNQIEHSQRIFECIGDTLLVFPDEKNFDSSHEYQNLEQTCISKRPWTPQCDPFYPYRTINGTCNNLDQPTLGSILDCSRRLFPANYRRTSCIRRSVVGKGNKRLLSPRSISLNTVKRKKKLSKTINALFIVFGQAVAHDMARYLITIVNTTEILDCCKHVSYNHPQCAPLLFNSNDSFYARQGVTCLNFIREVPCHSCSIDKRLPINVVTSFIDCSLTYGSTDKSARELRRNDGSGKLKSQFVRSEELLPAAEVERELECQHKADVIHHSCMEAGDTRNSDHALLAMIQTIFLREHNRIADNLKLLNPHWGEEKLYQESRKILIAEFQIIIYKEFLPIILGPKLMSKYGLNLGSEGSYDSTIDPSTLVEFNAAAFRLHTLIPSKFVEDEDFTYLRSLFINLSPLYTNRTSSYLSKMANYPAEEYDWYMPADVTNFMNKEKSGTYGYDLAAVDIQRGRDVGLPTYSQMIEYMENRTGTITKFSDLEKYLVPKCRKYLEESYEDVRDIDLWVGLNCEKVPDNMIISPTAAVIIAEQFRRSKFGDRFYVEHDVTLTPAQRKTLLNASLSKLICDNSYVEAIQQNAMLFPSVRNLQLSCSDIPSVDLNNWKELE